MELEPARPPEGRWLDLLPELARRAVHPAVFRYVESGSYDELTVAEATQAWREVRFRPRVLRGTQSVDLRTRVLGAELAAPIGIAPTAMQRAIHPLGERAMLAGAEAAQSLCVVSSNSGTRWGELGATRPWWLQVYVPTERERIEPVIREAVEAGATAVVLTADTPFPGTKYAVDDADWTGIDLDWWRVNFPPPHPDRWAADLGIEDVSWLAETAGVPVVVKGVLRADDAVSCVEAGASAVYVSNHGGRQLDRSVSTATALGEVVAAVGQRVEVYVDGGIRTGVDALAALALGAHTVFVGRPALYALAVDGAAGVFRLLGELGAELAEVLHLGGCAGASEAPGLLLREPPQVL